MLWSWREFEKVALHDDMNTAYPAYEGLQFVPQDYPGLEHTTHDGLEPIEGGHTLQDATKTAWTTTDGSVSPDGHEGYEKSPDYKGVGDATRRVSICGLRRRTFWILLIIAIIVVLGAGIGGGVGGTLANKSDNSVTRAGVIATSVTSSATSGPASSTSTTPATKTISSATTTTYAEQSYPTTSLGINCPAINGTTYSALNAQHTTAYTFDLFCNANFAAGLDEVGTNETSVDNCMQACVDNITSGGACVGVVWDSVMNLSLEPRRNCFLKKQQINFYYTGEHNKSASALLQL